MRSLEFEGVMFVFALASWYWLSSPLRRMATFDQHSRWMRVKDKLQKVKRRLRPAHSLASTVAYNDEEEPVPHAQAQAPQPQSPQPQSPQPQVAAAEAQAPQPQPKRRRKWFKTHEVE